MKPTALLLLTSFALSGCGAFTTTSREKRLEQRVETLSLEVETLKTTNADLQRRVHDLELRSSETSTALPSATENHPSVASRCVDRKGVLTIVTPAGVKDDFAALGTDARVVPNFEGGKARGFMIYSIPPDSFFASCGLKDRDVIQTINGFDLSSPDKALDAYAKLSNARTFDVALLREGKPLRLVIEKE